MASTLNYRDWYRHGPLASAPQADRLIVPQVDRDFHAGPVHLINVSPPAGAVVEPPIAEYALHLMLRTAPLLRVGFNRAPRWLAMAPGAMLLAPPDTSCEYFSEVPGHVLTIAMPKAQVEEFTRDAGVSIDVRYEEVFRDPRLMQQLVRLWHAADSRTAGSQLFADEVMRTLLWTLAMRGGSRPPARVSRERLSYRAIVRLRDFVESHLAEELDVTLLAGVVNLSPAHFTRAFAATLGMTPFRYVMMRRLARGRELLERTHRSMLDIALDVGFKTPSHFSARFRQEFGVTPGALRADVRDTEALWIALDAAGAAAPRDTRPSAPHSAPLGAQSTAAALAP